MAQKGYFSGKKEYEHKSKPGGNKGGYGKPYGDRDRQEGSTAYQGGGKGGYGKPYGNRDRQEGSTGYQGGGNKGGYGKPYGNRDRQEGSTGYQGGGKGGYGKSYGDRDRQEGSSGYQGGGNRGGYGKPYGNRDRQEGSTGYQGGGKGGYGKSYGDRDRQEGSSGYQGVGKGGYGKPYGNRDRQEGSGYRPYGRGKDTGERLPRPQYEERAPQQEERPAQEWETDELPFLIIGRNAVREALKSGRSIDRILVSPEPDGSLREIISLARDNKVQLRETPKKRLDEVCMPFGHGGKTANHQGIVAYAAGVSYCSVEDILQRAKEREEKPFVIVLDGIMDPHNLGSIIRSAQCAGAHGVVIGKRRSASVTSATVKASAGATEHMLIARVTNLATAVGELKKAGLWIAGAEMSGTPMTKQDLTGPLALIIGGEGDGLGKLVKDNCDYLVSIPIVGELDSLNASVAAGILMFEKRRQDGGSGSV